MPSIATRVIPTRTLTPVKFCDFSYIWRDGRWCGHACPVLGHRRRARSGCSACAGRTCKHAPCAGRRRRRGTGCSRCCETRASDERHGRLLGDAWFALSTRRRRLSSSSGAISPGVRPGARRFFAAGVMGRRPTSVEPENVLAPGREGDLLADAVFEHPDQPKRPKRPPLVH